MRSFSGGMLRRSIRNALRRSGIDDKSLGLVCRGSIDRCNWPNTLYIYLIAHVSIDLFANISDRIAVRNFPGW